MPDVKDVKVYKPNQDEIEKSQSWPVWSCGVSTFDWDYTQTETCYIIEGEVIVKDRPGNGEVSFSAGDMVVFPNGLSCVWEIKKDVKKHYKFD